MANWAAPNSATVGLNRPFAGVAGTTVTVNLIEPGTLYGDRVNQFDMRFAKILRFGRTRTNVGFDIYNIMNSSPVLTYNQTFVLPTAANPNGSWLTPTSVLQPRFVIPAYDGNAEVKGTTKLERDTVITSLTPHMHVRGKDMTYIAHYPDGTDEILLSVPKYDFNWQISYQLKTPKVLPKGTIVEVIAHFDNSAGNKFNPDPSKDVRWGDQTFEEMMIGFWSTVVPVPFATSSQPQQR